MVRSAQTVHLTYVMVSTISKQTENELPLEPRHLGVPSGAPETISEPMVHSTQTKHLSCVKISTISKLTETSFHFCIISYENPRVCLNQFLSRWYVWRKMCTNLALTLTLSPRKDARFHMTQVTKGFIGCVQNDFRAYGMFDTNRATILRQD